MSEPTRSPDAAYTTGTEIGPPVLFYDFNMPPTNGLFSVMPARRATHYVGQRVIFGCQSDEIMAMGEVVEMGDTLLRVRELGLLPVYESEAVS